MRQVPHFTTTRPDAQAIQNSEGLFHYDNGQVDEGQAYLFYGKNLQAI